MKLLIFFLTSLPLWACPYDQNQIDFYIHHFETHQQKQYHQVPKYNDCPTSITELDLSFINKMTYQMKNQNFLVSNHVRENILDENYLFAPLIIVKTP